MEFDTIFLKQLSYAHQHCHVSNDALKRLLALKYGKGNRYEEAFLEDACCKDSAAAHSGSGECSQITEDAPKFSIIIATHNRIDMLCRCIDSILEQRYPSIEVLVIDDCSTDSTQEVILNNYPCVRYFRNVQNLGPGGSRQKGYNLSSGEYIIYVDDDDFYVEPLFFAKAAEIFAQHKNVAMVCANCVRYQTVNNELIYIPLSFSGMMTGKQYLEGFMTQYKKPASTFPTVLRKSVLDQADFKNMWMMNDTSIYLRTLCFGDVYMLQDWVGVYWVHNLSIGKALPHKYIIDNLYEKRNIYQIAKKLFKNDLKQWYHAQLMITINHYLTGSLVSPGRFLSVLWWIIKYGHPTRKSLLRETINTQRKMVNNAKR